MFSFNLKTAFIEPLKPNSKNKANKTKKKKSKSNKNLHISVKITKKL
ncbi:MULTISPECIES: hypothetical protein [unclassified Rickettsia]